MLLKSRSLDTCTAFSEYYCTEVFSLWPDIQTIGFAEAVQNFVKAIECVNPVVQVATRKRPSEREGGEMLR